MLCKKSKSRLFRIKGTQLETKIVFQNKFEFCLKLVEVFFIISKAYTRPPVVSENIKILFLSFKLIYYFYASNLIFFSSI